MDKVGGGWRWGVVGMEIWKGLDEVERGGGGVVEVASVKLGRTHNLHGNSVISFTVAVRPAAHVTEWTGCADDQRWGGE